MVVYFLNVWYIIRPKILLCLFTFLCYEYYVTNNTNQWRGIVIMLEINLCTSVRINILFIIKWFIFDYFVTKYIFVCTFFFIIFQSDTFCWRFLFKSYFYYFLWGEITTWNTVEVRVKRNKQFWNPYEKKLCEFVFNEIIKCLFSTINNVRFNSYNSDLPFRVLWSVYWRLFLATTTSVVITKLVGRLGN